MTVSVPSVPGKTQRVLINKRQSSKATSSAARLYKKPLQSAGLSTSTNTSSHFTSFTGNSKSRAPAPFGSKDLRFNGKLELMEYFNKDPGPGTYSEFNECLETNINADLEKMRGLYGQQVD